MFLYKINEKLFFRKRNIFQITFRIVLYTQYNIQKSQINIHLFNLNV